MRRRELLIVDDNAAFADNLAEIFRGEGLDVAVFYDPGSAAEAFEPGRYGAALLDICLPGMDGVELYRHLRRRDPALPGIAVTAYASDDRLDASVEGGLLAVLTKPPDIERLIECTLAALAGRRILIVEDDRHLGRYLAELLLERGLSPSLAGSCDEARALTAEALFPVVMADWRLPDGDGLTLLEALSGAAGVDAAVLFSAYPRELIDPRGVISDRGITFLPKPLRLEQIYRAIDAAR
jgi:DNA-binding NtrC family response regulator